MPTTTSPPPVARRRSARASAGSSSRSPRCSCFNVAVTPNFLQPQTLFVNISAGRDHRHRGDRHDAGHRHRRHRPLGRRRDGARRGAGAADLRFATGRAPTRRSGSRCRSCCRSASRRLAASSTARWSAFLGVQPIIATLILFISGRGIALVLTNGNLQTFNNPSFSYLGTGRICSACPFRAGSRSRCTRCGRARSSAGPLYGRYLLAVGGNERAARLAGRRRCDGVKIGDLRDLRGACRPRRADRRRRSTRPPTRRGSAT